MGQLVKPEVFLTGFTEIHEPGVKAYLEKTKQMDFWDDYLAARVAGISGGESLCSMYAKLCYKSLVVGKNANVSKVRSVKANLESCFDTGHGSVFEHCNINFLVTDCSRVYCYEQGTEVYTNSGWKKIEDLTVADELLTLNPDTRKAKWQTPASVHSFDYDGKLLGWKTGQMVSPGMTPDHLLWAARVNPRRARGLSLAENVALYSEKVPISEVFRKPIVIDHEVSFAAEDDREQFQIGEHTYDAYRLMEWLGWMATDGTFSVERPNQCVINQSKVGNLPALHSLMSELFGSRWRHHGPYSDSRIEYFPYSDSRIEYFTISDGELSAWAKQMIGPNNKERHFVTDLFNLSRRLLRGFFAAAMSGDGTVHHSNGHQALYCETEHAAGQWQVLLGRLGLCANVRKDDRSGVTRDFRDGIIRHTKPSWVVSVSRKSVSIIKTQHFWEEDYHGKVYCPKTQDGIIYVRCHGLAFWCGNTHEQVRQRAGWAYSQTSGRYCRLDSIDLVWSNLLNPVKDLWLEGLSCIEDLVYLTECKLGLRKPNPKFPHAPAEAGLTAKPNESKCLAAWANIPAGTLREDLKWVPDDSFNFDKRKAITSAIRRIAPNGQANEIGMTANIRALRHVVQLRTAPFAETEIRDIFGQVFNLTRAKFPTLWYKSRTKIVDDLLWVYGMKSNPYDIDAGDPKALEFWTTESLQGELAKRADAALKA